MDAKLRERGSLLIVRQGKPKEEIPRLAEAIGAEVVFAGRDYEPYAAARDDSMGQRLRLELVKDVPVREAGEVLTQDGRPFRVYGPYRKAWLRNFRPEMATERKVDLRSLVPAAQLEDHTQPWGYEDIGFTEADLWTQAGEEAGRARMHAFAKQLPTYGDHRDIPSEHGTSELSVHFRFGTISVREAARLALENDGDRWLSELIWRDFFFDVLSHFPEVSRESFKPAFRGLHYPGKSEHLEAWKTGQTGFPIVDAAMRHLNATGFMPNRMRLVTAAFLCKDLLLDYREGEAYFARRLLDFDLGNNNGNWQWSASTGTDSQPYFRVFNPIAQGQKFDPHGAYIREWVPELKKLTDASIHEPWSKLADLKAVGVVLGKTYPTPIVDHAVQRERAKTLLRQAAQTAPQDVR